MQEEVIKMTSEIRCSVSKEVHAFLKEEAKLNGLPLNHYIRLVISGWANNRTLPTLQRSNDGK